MSVINLLLLFVSSAVASPVSNIRAHFGDYQELEQSRYLLTVNEAGDLENVDLLSLDVSYQSSGEEVSFHLYTKNNPREDEVIASETILESEYFDPTKKTVFVVHGWKDDYESELNGLIRDALLSVTNTNVVVVDWSPAAKCNYLTAMLSVVPVGKAVGQFINSLIELHDMKLKQFGIVGHSLGAHVSGNAGATVDGLVDYIVGLDPAGPLFTYGNTNNRLDPTDAAYVEIVHTSFLLGFHKPIGHIDFFPNGGMHQPGCGLDVINTCAHSRSYEYFAESLTNPRFLGHQCSSYEEFEAGNCNNTKIAKMAQLETQKRARGTFYLQTRGQEPFALN